MNGEVPVPPVRLYGAAVPPVLVEGPVPEASQLGQEVEPEVEVEVEGQQPHIGVRDAYFQQGFRSNKNFPPL